MYVCMYVYLFDNVIRYDVQYAVLPYGMIIKNRLMLYAGRYCV